MLRIGSHLRPSHPMGTARFVLVSRRPGLAYWFYQLWDSLLTQTYAREGTDHAYLPEWVGRQWPGGRSPEIDGRAGQVIKAGRG